MPKRTLPGLGLEAYFDLGENGWNDEYDENFRKLSFLVDGRVLSRTTNLPGTGSDGDVYIVPTGQTNAGQIAIWDGPTGSKAWVYYVAREGWAFYVLDEDKNYQFNGTTWVEFAAAGGGGGGTPTPATPVPTVYMQVVKGTTQAISAGTTTVVFESVVEDSESLWDAASNNIVIPAALNGKVVAINTQTQATADGSSVAESFLEKSTDAGVTWVRIAQSPNGGLDFFGVTSVFALDRVSTGDRFRLRYVAGASMTLRADDRCRMTLASLESSVVGGGGGSSTGITYHGARGSVSPFSSAATATWVPVAMSAEQIDTDGFLDVAGANPERFTIPAGVDRVRIHASIWRNIGAGTAASDQWKLYKNGSIMSLTDGGINLESMNNGYGNSGVHGSSGVLDVAEGDYFDLRVFQSAANVNFDVWLEIEVLEGSVLGAFGGGGGGSSGGGAATFLDLTDTPSAFTGQAGNAVIVNATEDGLEFGLAPGGGGGGAGSSENWAVPWRGATVTMAAQTLDLNGFTVLSWDTQAVDTDNFWDGAAPTVFTIPAGVTKVRCFMTLFLATGAISSSTALATFRKNGATSFAGNGIMGVAPGFNNQIQSLVSGVIDVVAGDEISVAARFGDSTIPVLAQTFFQIEVVEATDRSALSKLHPFFIPGLPGAGATVYQTVFTETTILKTTTPTELYAGVAATASSVFTLARNGVSVGTITVAAAGQTGTVSVGADVTFNAGDRLSVIAPGSQDATLADVAITLALQLTS